MAQSKILLGALGAGLLAGCLIRVSHDASLVAIAAAVKPIASLWLAALKMTLVPLIFAMVAGGICSFVTSRSGGRTLGLLFVTFAGLLAIGAGFGMAATWLILRLWPVPEGALAGLIAAPDTTPALPGLAEQLIGFIPENPVAAAAAGQMAPLVIFALFFGIAAAGIPQARRATLLDLLQGVGETMMRMVHGILWFAPLGVFLLALALGIGSEAGIAAAAALGQGVVICVLVMIGGIGLAYGFAALAGVDLRRFSAAAIGPQAMAAGTCSSMATLPAMIEAAETGMKISPALAGTILPLTASTFRFGTAISGGVVCVFASSVAGIHPSAALYAMAALMIVLSNVGVAGLPAAAVLYAADAPAMQVVGAPLGFLPLWIAVIAIPDIFLTVCNVTADLAIAAGAARLMGRRTEDGGPSELPAVREITG
jgi:Na+/H+-dicarboxylate symporter